MRNLVSIDNGGTFTDICVINESQVTHAKSLTTPHDLTKCLFDALTEASLRFYGENDVKRLVNETEFLRYSTTAGTNALVQRSGARLGLVFSSDASVGDLFATEVERDLFATLVQDRHVSVDVSNAEFDATITDAVNHLVELGATPLVVALDSPASEQRVKSAIVARFPRHLLGSLPVQYSYDLIDDGDWTRRTWSALVNAFLHPTMERFLYHAERQLRQYRTRRPLLIYGNDGSSSRVAKTVAIKTYGSGPRGGLEAAAAIARHYGIERVVTIDIGGTTTDVSILDDGIIRETDPGQLDGVTVSFRASDVLSSGVGGSSVFSVTNGVIQVGPRSVGAVPGPACFGRGGSEPTITDVYLLMGILEPDTYFGGSLVLDKERANAAVQEHVGDPLGLTLDDALLAMDLAYRVKLADAVAMVLHEGEVATLLAFGGAGPMNACGVAEALGITDVVIPRLAAVFSAFGVGFSDISHRYRVTVTGGDDGDLREKLCSITYRAERDMFAEGFDLEDCQLEAVVRLSDGKEISLALNGDLEQLDDGQHWLDLTVTKKIPHYEYPAAGSSGRRSVPKSERTQSVLAGPGVWESVPVLRLDELEPEMFGVGPLLIEDAYFTTRIQKGWEFSITTSQDIRLHHTTGR
jgi:N-methylhydantoinase A/oxoprolinase/acetone carboxylase beta subunit